MNRSIIKGYLILFILTISYNVVLAQDANDLLKKMDNIMFSPKDKTARMKMILTNEKSGKEKIREAELLQKGTNKKLFRYTAPENQAGFKWLQEVAASGCTAVGHGPSESRNTFAAGRAGVIFEGPWGRGLVENMSGGKMTVAPDGDVWVALMPKAPDGTRKTIGAECWSGLGW